MAKGEIVSGKDAGGSGGSGFAPIVEFVISPGQYVVAEPHALVWKDPHIELEAVMINDSNRKRQGTLGAIFTRARLGRIFTDHFFNPDTNKKDGKLVLHSPKNGNILRLNLAEYGAVLAHRSRFVASSHDIDFGIRRVIPFGNILNNQDVVMERLSVPSSVTKDGVLHVFLDSRGRILERTLEAGESVHIHQNDLLAMTESVELGLHKISGAANRWFGGEGRYFTCLTGPGTIWLQTSTPAAEAGNTAALSSAVLEALPTL